MLTSAPDRQGRVGFCTVVPPEAAGRTVAIAAAHCYQAQVIGRMRADLTGRVLLPGVGLEGDKRGFRGEARTHGVT